MLQELGLSGSDPLSLPTMLINIAIGAGLSLFLVWHSNRFSSTFAGRKEFSKVLPFILLTTVLIISVVKSSLALSLGLVGALSIVRFRTPIKEPEELAYLFLAIAMGLGLGANQTLVTVVVGPLILMVMAAYKWFQAGTDEKNLFLSIDWKASGAEEENAFLDTLNATILSHAKRCDLQRFDTREGGIEATYLVDFDTAKNLNTLIGDLKKQYPGIGVTFLDQKQLPGI